MKFVFIIFFYFSVSLSLSAQESLYLIDSIHIAGNSRTKDYIVFRELNFKTGDSILLSAADKLFEKNVNRLLGTALFVKADFNISEINVETKRIDITISVNEAWYIFPYVYLELTDRNYSEWIYEHKAALNRINVTFSLQHNNLSGNKDLAEIKLQTGITKKWELTYIRPFINKNRNFGISFNILKKKSGEIAYNTLNNKLVYYKDMTRPMFEQLRISSGITYRKSIYSNHLLQLTFFNNRIDTLVSNNLNPGFFNYGNKQKYFSIFYGFYHDKRDYKIYPTKGYILYLEVEKAGLGIFDEIDQLALWAGYEKHIPVWKNYFSSFNIEAKKNIVNNKSTYHNDKALGYLDRFLNGYELYVVDGQDYIYLKTAQKYNFLKGDLNLSKLISLHQFKHIPYFFYFSLNFDTGYVNNNVNFASNNFTNRLLYGYGAGIDFIIYHNLFRFTYSINHLGEDGLFFHLKTIF